VQNLLYEADRRISVEWSRDNANDKGRRQTYPVKVVVYCDDRAGMLKNLTAIISDDGTNIRSVDSRAGKDAEAIVEFIVEAEDVLHLDRIVTGLRTLAGVRDVERASRV
jgi:GTP pyrophosphokinase